MKIKEILSKNSFLYTVAQLIVFRKETKYIELMKDLHYNPEIVQIKPKRGSMFTTPVCCIESGRRKGMFACVRDVLDGLYFCDNLGFVPFIEWIDSRYADNSISEDVNPFEYYFEQPMKLKKNDLSNYPTVEFAFGKRTLAEKLNYYDGYRVEKEYITEMARIMREYLHFNSKTQKAIKDFLTSYSIDDKTIGVHIRGTDFRKSYKNHPVFVETSEYFPYIDEAIKDNRFNKIYLATDDQNILNEFIKNYGNKQVLYSENTHRGDRTTGVHTQSKDGGNHLPYQVGLEVICDMAGLAACSGIISGMSQVAICARIYKQSLNQTYLYDCYIDQKIHKRGKLAWDINKDKNVKVQ